MNNEAAFSNQGVSPRSNLNTQRIVAGAVGGNSRCQTQARKHRVFLWNNSIANSLKPLKSG